MCLQAMGMAKKEKFHQEQQHLAAGSVCASRQWGEATTNEDAAALQLGSLFRSI